MVIVEVANGTKPINIIVKADDTKPSVKLLATMVYAPLVVEKVSYLVFGWFLLISLVG